MPAILRSAHAAPRLPRALGSRGGSGGSEGGVDVPELGRLRWRQFRALAAFLNGSPNEDLAPGDLPDLGALSPAGLRRVVSFVGEEAAPRPGSASSTPSRPGSSAAGSSRPSPREWEVDDAALLRPGWGSLRGRDCAICCQPFRAGGVEPQALALPCAARGCQCFFHDGCIRPWLERKPSCPLCRRDLRAVVRPRAPAVGGEARCRPATFRTVVADGAAMGTAGPRPDLDLLDEGAGRSLSSRPALLEEAPGGAAATFRPVPYGDSIGRIERMGNEAVGALNWLAGFRNGPTYFDPDPMQLEVLERICDLASRRYPGPDALSERAAVRRLLRGHAPCDGAGCLARVAPFRKDLVSLAETVEGCPPFEDVAPPEVQRFLKGQPERMLRDGSQAPTVMPYFDPALKRSAKTHRHFVADLRRRGLPRWARRPRCQAGLFFVGKDSGKRLRLILGARPANELFEAPPGVELLTAEGLGRVDCFRRLQLPSWLTEYICLPEVPAFVLGVEGQLWEGCPLGRHGLVSPCWGVFPMGLTWGPWAAQRINERKAARLGPAGPVGHAAHYVCVDNLGVASTSRPLVSDAVQQLVRGFDEQGLVFRGSSVSVEAEALGLLIFLASDWALQWKELVVATDSSLEAGTAFTTRWPHSMVAEAGRVQGRARSREVAAGPLAAEAPAGAACAGASWGECPAAAAACSDERRADPGAAPPEDTVGGPADWQRQIVADSDGDSSTSDEQQGSADGQTFLERRPAFLEFCDAGPRRPMRSPAQVGDALVDYMNALFFSGHESSKGDQAMAGLMYRFPEYSTQGESKTPRAWRCLRGWRKLAPGRSRRAWPLALWYGLAWRMVARGALQMAIFLLAMVSGYFRPSHLLSLTRGNFITPAGLADVVVMLDSGWFQCTTPIFRELAQGIPEEEVWDFSYFQFLKMFRMALQDLGSWSLLPASLRDTLNDCESRLEDILLGKGAGVITQ
ncbi:unnamed protein product [Prorocentrum cordatum]|uniref:RING-type domain-containing protein n=2 Tax=Prorocentrum cordatum TaxID=2364126 RepID=A0ABN9V6M3_9DINO|nr:unnamed protein product [Polarella glacialis]